jgi:hypothetical protein
MCLHLRRRRSSYNCRIRIQHDVPIYSQAYILLLFKNVHTLNQILLEKNLCHHSLLMAMVYHMKMEGLYYSCEDNGIR